MAKDARKESLDYLIGLEKTSSRALDLSRISDPRDRALATELVNGTIRWLGFIDGYLAPFSNRALSTLSPAVRNCLRLGAYQLLFMGLPPHAAVNSVVRCLKSKGNRGYANAVLRSVSTHLGHIEMPCLENDTFAYISQRYSYPLWMVKRFCRAFRIQDAIRLCSIQNSAPIITLRVNTSKTSRHEMLELFNSQGYKAKTGVFEDSIRLEQGRNVRNYPGYNLGYFTVQDEGAMAVVKVLDPRPGDIVWDVCAAPGTKSSHISLLMNGTGMVAATDIDPDRIGMIDENIARLKLKNIKCLVSDATQNCCTENMVKMFGEFDRILVDAPCSGLRVIRRNPDIKWNRLEADIKDGRQAESIVAPGFGCNEKRVLVYSTCTLTEEENEEVWNWFWPNTGI